MEREIMSPQYNAKEVEDEIYQRWETGGFFAPKSGQSKKAFSIIMPPPNANGSLHLGHGVGVTLEDIMIRYHRMKGEETLWLPGADHAGFETQVVYQKKLEKEGRNWFTIPREQLYQEIWEFTQKNKIVMENQLRHLGASCDWSREVFALDKGIIKIVYQTFKKLSDDGLLYRGERVVNWCIKHQTTLSDLEVKHEDKDGSLTYIKYPIKKSVTADAGSRQGGKIRDYIVVATTRPETMLGDTAVAVNPKDKRYKKLIGQIVVLPLTGREVPIVADEAVEMEFGTGAVKVTPAHDPVDFEIGERHHLPKIQVIGQDGKMTTAAGSNYAGLKTEEARAKVVDDLRGLGLVEKEEPYKHAVGVCYKCGRVIEPLVLPQWFIKMKPLAEKAMSAVKKGEVKFVTKHFEKILFHWLKNIRDWNISRQIVWGIRIPAWYCQRGVIASEAKQSRLDGDCHGPMIVGPRNDGEKCPPIITDGKVPEKCPHCGGKDLKQETDVFDTWFSSGQWPFATLQTTGDFEKFYPTSVMETGWDILPFWVMRMLALGIYVTGKVPFKYIYLHGLVRDKDRQKMSKSKGNVVDPLGVVDLYGADALRMALVFGVSAGNDIIISEDKIRAHRNFANKIWNASRFVLSKLDKIPLNPPLPKGETVGSLPFPPEADPPLEDKKGEIERDFKPEDKKILKDLDGVIKGMTKYLDKFEFHLAAETIYQFFWHNFCDRYLEAIKQREDKEVVAQVLYKVLTDSLKLLHPFMPFVTEAVWQKLPKEKEGMLITENWPE